MPIPKPTLGESQDDFMKRCMGNDTMRSEYPEKDQRVAVCMTSFRGKEEDMDYEHETLEVCAEIKALNEENGESKGEFTGYGSIFGNKDLGNDIVVNGAFARSIASKGARGVKLLYQHKADEPIGVFDEIIEDKRGLKVKGRLALGTQRGKEVYELMKMGALDGLSIGYRVDAKGYEYDDKGKRRYIKEVDLMEISAVTFPMNPKARVNAVKGAERTVREWEELLRDAGDLSRNEAKVAASAVAKALTLREADEDEQPEVIEAVKRLSSILKGE